MDDRHNELVLPVYLCSQGNCSHQNSPRPRAGKYRCTALTSSELQCRGTFEVSEQDARLWDVYRREPQKYLVVRRPVPPAQEINYGLFPDSAFVPRPGKSAGAIPA
ncbi:hypothetical protein PsYK624_046600 [Phanerochaete sordida]|uniref:Uncharacterized protein n=1 Tax=Phanerochaete sordida TaxID=48140 RepID=A0A9P3G5Q5_9APHY|nr:hypothetical protein PsYK624_046600 [Phanerochaete sordida]